MTDMQKRIVKTAYNLAAGQSQQAGHALATAIERYYRFPMRGGDVICALHELRSTPYRFDPMYPLAYEATGMLLKLGRESRVPSEYMRPSVLCDAEDVAAMIAANPVSAGVRSMLLLCPRI